MAITFINSTAKTVTASASTWSIECHSSRMGGAGYVLGVGLISTSVTVSSVGDNLGGQFTLAIRRGTPKTESGAELWFQTNISSASTRIFVGLSGATTGGLALGQFDGLSTANALGPTVSSAITVNSTTHSVAEINSSGLAVSFARLTASTTGTATILGGMSAWVTTTALPRSVGLYRDDVNPSTVTGTFTTSSNALHAAVMAMFFDTAGGGAAADYPPDFGFCLRGVQ